jgi:membrane protein DedA with SNARE-associated domain
MLAELVEIILNILLNFGYIGIILLMMLSSTFIPFPSWAVLPPAAFIAYQGGMNVYIVFICGVVGSLLGALFNYYFALFLGRSLIYKFADSKVARLMFLSSVKLQKAEVYFNTHGNIATFVGRLLPSIRQVISIPAGLARMRISNFILYTLAGTTIWAAILTWVGYAFGEHEDLMRRYIDEISIGLAALMLLVIGLYILKLKYTFIYSKAIVICLFLLAILVGFMGGFYLGSI